MSSSTESAEKEALAAIEQAIELSEQTFNCVQSVASFYQERAANDYAEFLKNPYPTMMAEFGEELCTIDENELRSLLDGSG